MVAQLLVGCIPISGAFRGGGGGGGRARWITAASSSASGGHQKQNHYGVLGLTRYATSADIKRAYRLLARKFHPDVCKDSQAEQVFKSIRQAYEILSNEATRIQYDQELKYQKQTGRQCTAQRNYSPEFEDGVRIYKWDQVRQNMKRERQWEHYNVNETSNGKSDEASEREPSQERGSFGEVLRSAFVSLFLLHTVGSLLSLSFSSLMALLDRKLDAGYKIGYVIAWILGGRGGILLSLCLSFASWICGKTSSSMVSLVVVALWVGLNLARFAPLPQGALLTLLYMSIKLQGDRN
ncbi:PREDICTED: dnaJ homolog subfamily B member 12 [Fragaria vesca subsp. vesca]|uniref:dnaJ homolog subfamily B member 12 n=1 Tax=Fragaria vesca subsp. vesca TaxID=101020 RepID=UPI0002C35E4C|nr:PREDICTED: dnaJ homolog subfamily B member 12 [Fragaria vesca subsp. vesca]